MRVFFLGLAFTCLFGSAPSWADGVTITGDHPAQNIDMKIDGETVGAVLQKLREKYGIEISGVDKLESDDPVSMTISGSLPTILDRLLRNQNYMLVRSPKNATGVAKILIAGNSHSDSSGKPATPTPPPPANNSSMP